MSANGSYKTGFKFTQPSLNICTLDLPYNIKNKISSYPTLINNIPVPNTGTYTCLDVSLDEWLTWEKTYILIQFVLRSRAGIGIRKRMKPFVPPKTLKKAYEALVEPYFNYCSPLWDNCGIGLKEDLHKFQNRAARESDNWIHLRHSIYWRA